MTSSFILKTLTPNLCVGQKAIQEVRKYYTQDCHISLNLAIQLISNVWQLFPSEQVWTCWLPCVVKFLASVSAVKVFTIHKIYPYSYPHSPSLSRIITVVISLPGTNEAGAVTLPETTKLSVPSTKESSMISIEAFWVLPVVAPWSNVSSCAGRQKSSLSKMMVEEKIIVKVVSEIINL